MENPIGSADSGRIVEVITAEEEPEHIKVALKTALIHRPAKVVERMGREGQQLLGDKNITIVALASLLGASRRMASSSQMVRRGMKNRGSATLPTMGRRSLRGGVGFPTRSERGL